MVKIDVRSWLTTIAVTPRSRDSSWINRSMRRALTGSRPVVGSSNSTSSGAIASVRAIAARLRMPSDSSAG